MATILDSVRRELLRKRAAAPDWWDVIWLFYTIFLFIEPIERHNGAYWVQFGIVYAIFVALYMGLVFLRRQLYVYLCLLAMVALGVYYYRHNAAAYGMFMYVAAFAPFVSESVVVGAVAVAAMAVLTCVEGMLLQPNPWTWGFGTCLTLVIGGTNIFMSLRVRANKKLRMAQEEIEQLAKMAERERIARDLHDVLGHTLSVIVLKAELAGRLIGRDQEGDHSRATAEIGDVEQIARKALTEVREAIRGYRAEGLSAELRRAQSVLDAAGVALVCEEQPLQLSASEESVLSLVLREAVTNIVRHAQASRCLLRVEKSGEETRLIVEDNGRGGLKEDGNGVRGMRQRIEALGGEFATDTVEGRSGTRLTIRIPGTSTPNQPAWSSV
ncbi:sensor histidine kinase [Silvibacterium dinghuense]|uniref:Sensor histidine kinase n=1 Tax=Silvibacterium dinghuense TaxID=1560006 RepID=A0A4Q1SGT6_9BACT|nr:sensor histidine kinase [Silvibacterium dinghuense]RXS96543.1 sensor histidine kinase [Silvibacterium dinghuense]GGG91636.1 histidine kinase [Silvibacterium dinghuense]